jgi:signal-transduction protein with cAMP-binding, CBS, and nucleotidyltransferase domain
MQQRVTIKAYAIKHKLSIFNVMKMVKSRKLKTDIVEEDGKEVTYILLDEAIEKEIQKGIVPIEEKDDASLKEMIRVLQKEVRLLREEIEVLKKRL